MSYVTNALLPHLTGLRAEIAQLREDRSRLAVKVEALEIIAQANENTMNIWEGEATRQRLCAEAAEATMRKVAEDMREYASDPAPSSAVADWADRLFPLESKPDVPIEPVGP